MPRSDRSQGPSFFHRGPCSRAPRVRPTCGTLRGRRTATAHRGRGAAPDTPGSRFPRCDGLSDRCDRPTRTSQRTEAPSMWRPGSRVVLLFAPGDSIRERRGSGQRAPAHCEDTARTLRGPPAAPRSHRAVHTVPFPPAVPLRPRPVRAFAPSPYLRLFDACADVYVVASTPIQPSKLPPKWPTRLRAPSG